MRWVKLTETHDQITTILRGRYFL